MNQIDIIVLIFVLFGGWLGYQRGIARAFVGFASTILGFGVASLYGNSFTAPWLRVFQGLAPSFRLEADWATMSSTNVNWQQAAYSWLDELPWPANLKQWVINSWQHLASDSTFAEWGHVVEQAFWQGLANICSFLTIMIIVKLVVGLIAKLSLRLAFNERRRALWPGFVAGILQSVLLVFLIVALALPFLVISERTTPMLRPSFTFTLVQRILANFIAI
ncbi:MAG: CvpA family protein [Firmicutes bacterium]|nr:CvpA family protein [Bacillota bacterium]